MELTSDEYAKFRDYCKEIRPGEYGRVVVSFIGEPSNVIQITVEKNTRYQRQKADVPAHMSNDLLKTSKKTAPYN